MPAEEAQPDYAFLVPDTGPEGGPGDTVLSLLETVKTPAALVVLGDTHFQFADGDSALASPEPFVLTSPVNESYRWCVAEVDRKGYVSRFRNKISNLPPPLEGLIGVYFFPDADLALVAAREASTVARKNGSRLEISDILDRLHQRTPVRVIATGEWLDVGNPDRQADSQVSLLQKREFNELSIDPVLGTITKTSRNREKFRDEINYFRLLPPELSVLFPRLLSASPNAQKPAMTMEYYGYPSLAEVFLYHQLDSAIWERVFAHLCDIITTAFVRHEQKLPRQSVIDMYLTKTRARMEQLTSEEFKPLRQSKGPLVINDKPVPSVEKLWPRIERDVEKLADNAKGAVIHGDFCFSNILYDLRSQICKLVDPRGSFGQPGIMGDPRYDVAKLYHSVYGLYDFITNDLFRIEIAGEQIQLDIRTRLRYRPVVDRFDKVFFESGKFDRREILLITALIFLGIPALHYDSPPRQRAMFARGLQILAELYPS
jgi:hypothetical protein